MNISWDDERDLRAIVGPDLQVYELAFAGFVVELERWAKFQ